MVVIAVREFRALVTLGNRSKVTKVEECKLFCTLGLCRTVSSTVVVTASHRKSLSQGKVDIHSEVKNSCRSQIFHAAFNVAFDSLSILSKVNLSYFAGEAEQMAAHFDYLCEAEFPGAQLAEHVAKQSIESTDLQNRKNAVIAAK